MTMTMTSAACPVTDVILAHVESMSPCIIDGSSHATVKLVHGWVLATAG